MALHLFVCLAVVIAILGGSSNPSYLATASPTNQRGRHHRHGNQESGVVKREEVCSEPSDLKQQLDDLQTSGSISGRMHETFYILPFFQQVIKDELDRTDFRTDTINREKVFSGSDQCPADDDDEESVPSGEPCPTYTSVNYNGDRYPRVLLESRCRCEFCRGVNNMTRDDKLVVPTCDAMFYHVRVLKRLRDCRDGVYQYAPTWEKLQVGCACRLVPFYSNS